MSAHKLVERLDHCKPAGKDKWVARCPAHEDSSPSLTITEKADGRVLIHCFAGCGALDIITAVGLDWEELFPPSDGAWESFNKSRLNAPTETVDSLVIEIAKADRASGKRLSKADTERLRLAMKRQPRESDAITEIAYEGGYIE